MKTLIKEPKQARSKALVEAISEAATRILKKAGYKNTTTNWVAEKAGVSVGSLYQYFPNKDAIVSFLIEQALSRLAKQSQQKIKQMNFDSYSEANRAFIIFAVDLFYDYRDELRALTTAAPFVEYIQEWNRVRNQFTDLLAQQLRDYQDELQVEDFDMTAYILHHSVMGVLQAYILDPEKDITREVMIGELSRMTEAYARGKTYTNAD